jgi:hypothetical protein
LLKQLIGSPRDEIRTPVAAIDHNAVRRQLERLISNPLFSQSRRYSNLLRYLVEETLNGHSSHLKERTVGVEVFGREPSYDTNTDPVVRTTAAQLRHRIVKYYAQPGHESEIRIGLPPGAYVPEFLEALECEAPPRTGSVIHRVDIAEDRALRPVSSWLTGPRRWLAIGIMTAVLSSLSVAAFTLLRSAHKDVSLRSFWDPVWDSSGSVLLCIGEQGGRRQIAGTSGGTVEQARGAAQANTPNPGPSVRESLGANSVAWPDAIVLAELSGLARANRQAIRLRKSSLIAFVDLRDSPDILVGGFNNQWIMRLGKNLRFRFMMDRASDTQWIQDQQNPAQQNWQGHLNAPYSGFLTDYGLITRVMDQSTEKTVVIASGMAAYGTMAAGEFLTSERYMKMVTDRAPKGWDRKNLQVVFSTEVIGGNAGPPRILATYFW